jgi:hypothetical protein
MWRSWTTDAQVRCDNLGRHNQSPALRAGRTLDSKTKATRRVPGIRMTPVKVSKSGATKATDLPLINIHNLTLRSPAIYRAALKPVILSGCLPTSHAPLERCATWVTEWQQPWSLASQAAADAAGLAQLAAQVQSELVANHARQRLLDAVARMRTEMADTNIRVEALSATAQALMVTQVSVQTKSLHRLTCSPQFPDILCNIVRPFRPL